MSRVRIRRGMHAERKLRAMFAMAALTMGLSASATAGATASHDSPYTFKQTFGSALRLVKVDLDLEVSETNAEWGYFLFVYKSRESGKRRNRGAFSFVEQEDGTVRVSLQMPQMPNYHEQLIVDKLRSKLHDEHGEPAKRVKAKPPKDEPEEDKPDADKPAEGDKADKPRRPRWQRPARR